MFSIEIAIIAQTDLKVFPLDYNYALSNKLKNTR